MTEEQRYWLEKNFIFELLKRIPTQVFWKNKQGVYLGCNDAFAHSLGLDSPDDVIGKTDFDLPTTEEANETYRADDKQIMDSKQPKLNIEELQTFIDGRTVVLLTSKVPLLDASGKVVGILGIYSDITERKKEEQELIYAKEQAEGANKLKTEFIQNMQHDIRTPISGIWSLLENASQSENLEEFRSYIPFGAKAAKELLELCNDVIDFENIEYGDKPVYSRKFSLLELVHSAINLNSAAVLAHKSSLELKIDDDVPDIIKGDDYRLKKILINLIGNAVKFTEKGKVSVRVNLINKKNKKITIHFAVEDTGIGIPEEKLPAIFEKFTRLNPSNRGKFKGSGLGLHIVKKFVNEIGAELDVKSVINEGTLFTVDVVFELPLAQQLAGEKAHQELNRNMLIDIAQVEKTEEIAIIPNKHVLPPQATSIESTADTIRICLIEDSPIAMIAAEKILARLSHSCYVEKAVNVAEALDVLSRSAFDLVICDLGLPDGTGFDIITHIKNDTSHLNFETPFVALTAHSDDGRKELAKKSGFLGFYNKPFSDEAAEKILVDHVLNENIIVDLELTAKTFNDDKATALEMLTMLVASFAEEKILFKDAFSHNDYTRARELFHKFRGGISYMRIPQVDILAMILHDEVKTYERENKPLTELNDKLKGLFKAVDDVQAWLERFNKT